jgi:hypothetical protein
MSGKSLFSFALGVGFLGLTACGGADETYEQTEREIFTQPGTETVEMQIPTEDTMMVERTIQTEVTVDTTRVDGAAPRTTTGTGTTAPGTVTPGVTAP